MTDLAITARCLEHDLLGGLGVDVAEHILEVFVERRGTNPESGEMMARVGGPLRKLHADLPGGRSVRAVTWYDPGRDVCWLLAAGMHEKFYGYVEELARTDAHLPTATDKSNFEADAPIRLMSRVIRNAKPALEEAVRHPGQETPVTDSLKGNWPQSRWPCSVIPLWTKNTLPMRSGTLFTLWAPFPPWMLGPQYSVFSRRDSHYARAVLQTS